MHRAVAGLSQFVNLELNGNEVCEAGVEAVRAVLQGAGKILGGEFCLVLDVCWCDTCQSW